MDIEKIRLIKENTEAEITDILDKFQEMTGEVVSEILLSKIASFGEGPGEKIVDVNLVVKI